MTIALLCVCTECGSMVRKHSQPHSCPVCGGSYMNLGFGK